MTTPTFFLFRWRSSHQIKSSLEMRCNLTLTMFLSIIYESVRAPALRQAFITLSYNKMRWKQELEFCFQRSRIRRLEVWLRRPIVLFSFCWIPYKSLFFSYCLPLTDSCYDLDEVVFKLFKLWTVCFFHPLDLSRLIDSAMFADFLLWVIPSSTNRSIWNSSSLIQKPSTFIFSFKYANKGFRGTNVSLLHTSAYSEFQYEGDFSCAPCPEILEISSLHKIDSLV